jgi:DNA-binding CsgD family transcriptional regulator
MGLRIIRGRTADGGYITRAKKHITLRELEALRFSAVGLDNREAAEKMGISLSTYRNHICSMMKKMKATNRAHALLIALENDMVEASHNKYLLGWTPDEWLYCLKCHRVFPPDKALLVEVKQVVVDYPTGDFLRSYVCPYKGCGAEVSASSNWRSILDIMPEFPDVPKMGKTYEVDWAREAEALAEMMETDEEIEERMKEEQEKKKSR